MSKVRGTRRSVRGETSSEALNVFALDSLLPCSPGFGAWMEVMRYFPARFSCVIAHFGDG